MKIPIQFYDNYAFLTTSLGQIFRKHDLKYHMYADDTQIYLSIDAPQLKNEKCRLESCLDDIKIWMLSNKLKFKDDKTESIVCIKENLILSWETFSLIISPIW